MKPIPLAAESHQLASPPASSQRLINLYAERLPEQGRGPFYLKPTPGLTYVANMGAGPHLASATVGGSWFGISGETAYRLQDVVGATPDVLGSVGAVPNSFYHASIAVGLVGVVFCVPPRAYITDFAAAPLQQITTGTGNFPAEGASSVAYLDGYYIFTSYSGDRFFVSDILNPTSYNSLNFVQMSSQVDFFEKAVAHNGELWMFGQNTISAWYNTGDPNAPFAPRSGAVIRPGIGAPRTVAQIDNSLWWLGIDNVVYRTQGYQAKRVSTHAIEELLADYDGGYLRTAVGCAFMHEGHAFYALSLPEAGFTFVYDCATGVWHERTSAADGIGRWNINTAAALSARTLFGSSVNGNLYHMESSVLTDAGVTVPRSAVLPPLVTHGPRAFMSRLEVEMEVGLGNSASYVRVDWSDDGGINWSLARDLSTGALGATRTRVATNRLGSFRQRLLRLWAPGPITVYGVDVDVSQGSI